MYPEVSSEGVLLIPLLFISNTGKEKEKLDFFYTVLAREDKTIEIAVPFPTHEKVIQNLLRLANLQYVKGACSIKC